MTLIHLVNGKAKIRTVTIRRDKLILFVIAAVQTRLTNKNVFTRQRLLVRVSLIVYHAHTQ